MKPTRDYRVEHIKARDAKNDRSKHLHVTDLSRCPGGVWQEKTGRAVQEVNDAKLRRFDAGHNIEERVVDAMKHAGVLVDTQGQLAWPEYNMVGSYDLVIDEEDQRWLIEVKSIHVFGMNYLYKDGHIHDHYREQVNLYLSKLREDFPDIKARIYYEALDGRTFEEEIVYDPAIVGAALKKAEALHQAIQSDKIPEPIPALVQENGKWTVNWRAKYCIENGTHHKCDPDNVLDPDPKKWINKLSYQAKKLNG